MAGMFPSNNCLSHKDRLYKAEKRIYLVLDTSCAYQKVGGNFNLAVALLYPPPDRPLHPGVPFGAKPADVAVLN